MERQVCQSQIVSMEGFTPVGCAHICAPSARGFHTRGIQSRDRVLLRLPPYVTVPLQHLLADMPRQRFDRLLRDGGILGKPRDEGVA